MKKVTKQRKRLHLNELKKMKEMPLIFELGPSEIRLNGLLFDRTSITCPEKYEIYDDDKIYLATVQLRHGVLLVKSVDKNIYYEDFEDWEMNNFKSQEMRIKYLKDISNIVIKKGLK